MSYICVHKVIKEWIFKGKRILQNGIVKNEKDKESISIFWGHINRICPTLSYSLFYITCVGVMYVWMSMTYLFRDPRGQNRVLDPTELELYTPVSFHIYVKLFYSPDFIPLLIHAPFVSHPTPYPPISKRMSQECPTSTPDLSRPWNLQSLQG